eukprot:GFUD01002547.1.p1 GENE.GFUD01002547.1~~GFUD01002547.1.p1  ORF type:complete len:408 (-),score=139.00 GFUD01002547.1:1060-2283(-)
MGDSDDEREFKRRDKFHTERRGHDGGERFGGGEWREPRPGPPPGYGGGGGFRGRSMYGGDFRRERYSPERGGGGRRHEMSPPPKRMRGGWEDDRYGGGYEGGGYDREYDRPPPTRHFSRGSKPKEEDLEGFQPAMMSFKAFLQTQDDQISDEDAIKKYAEYKLEFKRQQLNEFFVTHKEEEWFKQKYHPDESVKRKDELREMLQKRVEVFQEFMEQGKFERLTLDGEKQDALIKVLDSVVIKLEGGSDFDITVLDLPDPEEEQKKEEASKKKDSLASNDTFDDENAELMKKAKEFLNFMDPADKEKKIEEESKKRKRVDESDEKDDEAKEKDSKDSLEENDADPKSEDLDAVSDGEDAVMKEEGKNVTDIAEKEENEDKAEESSKPSAVGGGCCVFFRVLVLTITTL